MQNHQLEAKVLNILERVVNGQTVEDDTIDLKATWISDHRKTARQIAGHANGASGQPILWIIGVDENNRAVPGVDHAEYSGWWNKVRSCFSELAPEPKILNVPFNGATVTALLFQTDRPPYVVTTERGGQVSLEVPYRVGTGTQSANRQQLLSILSTQLARPTLEIVEGILTANCPPGGQPLPEFYAKMVLHQPQTQETFLAVHKARVFITDGVNLLRFNLVQFSGLENEFVSLIGTQTFRISATASPGTLSFLRDPAFKIYVEFWVDALASSISVALPLKPDGDGWLTDSPQPDWTDEFDIS